MLGVSADVHNICVTDSPSTLDGSSTVRWGGSLGSLHNIRRSSAINSVKWIDRQKHIPCLYPGTVTQRTTHALERATVNATSSPTRVQFGVEASGEGIHRGARTRGKPNPPWSFVHGGDLYVVGRLRAAVSLPTAAKALHTRTPVRSIDVAAAVPFPRLSASRHATHPRHSIHNTTLLFPAAPAAPIFP